MGGLPQFNLVGLPDSAVKESSERVRSAVKKLHYAWPASRITINLAPADVRKTGPVYDLPVFVGILAAQKLPAPAAKRAFLGAGAGRHTAPRDRCAADGPAAVQNGVKELFLPAENAAEAAVAEGLTVYPARSAQDVVLHLCGAEPITPPHPMGTMKTASGSGLTWPMCAGRARPAVPWRLQRPAGITFTRSPPGTGKSMLAKRLPGILPPLSYEEALETSAIYSVAGLLRGGAGLYPGAAVPQPAPQCQLHGHRGRWVRTRPGEVSLAHNGVLFLDELPEFARDTLEVLRQPLEDGRVTVSRVHRQSPTP